MAQETMTLPSVARSAAGRHCRKDKMAIGTVVIRERSGVGRSRKARYIKIRDDGPPGRRWVLYARWWWEKHRGPVPSGMLVIHMDGDELNDDPSNLILGTHGTKLKLAHRDDVWSREQHRKAAEACGEYNRLNGKVNRLREYLNGYWYPVLDSYGIILNVPFKKRRAMLGAFGMDVTDYPMNGSAKKWIKKGVLELGIRPVRSQDLAHEHYQAYVRLDPEFEVGCGVDPIKSKVKEKLELIRETAIWKRAKEIAAIDLRDRKTSTF